MREKINKLSMVFIRVNVTKIENFVSHVFIRGVYVSVACNVNYVIIKRLSIGHIDSQALSLISVAR